MPVINNLGTVHLCVVGHKVVQLARFNKYYLWSVRKGFKMAEIMFLERRHVFMVRNISKDRSNDSV